MAEPVSDEVRAMQQEERRRWLTVAEAQRLRASWDKVRSAVGAIAEKYDENPEDQATAEIFILCATLTVSGFGADAHAAVQKMTELNPKRSGDA